MYKHNTARVIKHSISIEYTCPSNGATHSVRIENPRLGDDSYFEDWTYHYIAFKCRYCGNEHKFEI